jgi:hypothetical protein
MKRYVITFTNGNATSVDARSKTEAKRLTQGTAHPSDPGTPRKVKDIRECLVTPGLQELRKGVQK